MHQSGQESTPSPCAEIRRLVFEFLDDELGPPQSANVADHLERCPPCNGYFTFERTFLAVVQRRVPIDQAPAELRDRIRAALADRKRSDPAS